MLLCTLPLPSRLLLTYTHAHSYPLYHTDTLCRDPAPARLHPSLQPPHTACGRRRGIHSDVGRDRWVRVSWTDGGGTLLLCCYVDMLLGGGKWCSGVLVRCERSWKAALYHSLQCAQRRPFSCPAGMRQQQPQSQPRGPPLVLLPPAHLFPLPRAACASPAQTAICLSIGVFIARHS